MEDDKATNYSSSKQQKYSFVLICVLIALALFLIGRVINSAFNRGNNESLVADGPHKFERSVCTDSKSQTLDKDCYAKMLRSSQVMDNAVNDSLESGRQLACTDKYGNVNSRCVSDRKYIDDAVKAAR